MKPARSIRAGLVLSALLTLIASALASVAANAATTRYEAENATISQGILETTHTGFSGAGYVNGDNAADSYVQFAVNAPVAGAVTLAVRYANGTTANRAANISVNGAVVSTAHAFNGTGSWDTWATASVQTTLTAGANTVRVTATTANGNPNLDYIEVVTTDAPGTEYQAESAVLSQAGVFSDHTGFTGTGFVDYVNTTGGYIEWTVSAAKAGPASLVLRYANGTSANRPMDIAVNGTVVSAGHAFNATANWDTWADAAISADLVAGTNTVRATATTANGGPNVDRLTVSGTGGTDDPVAPSVPADPLVTGTTATTISLSWTPSTDNVGVIGYHVYEGSAIVADPSGNTVVISGLAPLSSHAYSITAVDAAGNESGHSATVAGTTTAGSGNPYGDPNLVSMFNGTTLDGWTPHAAGGWTVKSGAIHGTGTAGRGWIYYNRSQVGSFRWIFNVRQVTGDHAPTVLIWGTTDPIRDALSAIQFQPPNGGHWDYRPGHNDGGGSLFKQFSHTKIDVHAWSQCEIVGNQNTGIARMACCPLPTGAATCKGFEVLDFKDPTAGRVGPLAIQIHNGGIQDEYKSLYLESPVVTEPDNFITD